MVTSRNHVSEPPTLSALGLTKRESVQAQMLAKLPEPIFQPENEAGRLFRACLLMGLWGFWGNYGLLVRQHAR